MLWETEVGQATRQLWLCCKAESALFEYGFLQGQIVVYRAASFYILAYTAGIVLIVVRCKRFNLIRWISLKFQRVRIPLAHPKLSAVELTNMCRFHCGFVCCPVPGNALPRNSIVVSPHIINECDWKIWKFAQFFILSLNHLQINRKNRELVMAKGISYSVDGDRVSWQMFILTSVYGDIRPRQ